MSKKIIMDPKFFILSLIVFGLILNSFNYVVRSEDFLNKPSLLDYNCYDNKPFSIDKNGFIFYLDIEVDKKIVITNNSLDYYLLNNSKNINIKSIDFKIIDETKNSYVIRYIFKTGFFNGSGFDFVPKIGIYNYEELAWYSSSWKYKKMVTIESDYIDEDLVNFPFPINITDSDLKDYAQSDGDDIMFVNGSEDFQYNHEIEYYDNSYGNLVAWVNITYLDKDSDYSFYMYFGNPDCSSQESITDTWNSDYFMVHHLHDCPEDTGTFYDSTVNNNDGTLHNPNGDGVCSTDILDTNYRFQEDHDDNYIDVGTQSGFKSVSLWICLKESHDAYDFLIGHNDFRVYLYTTDGEIRFSDGNNHLILTNYNMDDHIGEWVHIVCVSNGGSSKVYVDNVDYTDTDVFDTPDSETLNFGRWTGDSHYCNEDVDEIEFFESVLTDDFVDSLFNSQEYAYDGGFFRIGSLEQRPDDWHIFSNPNPGNNSEINCLNITNWCINVNSSYGISSGWVNITVVNVTFSNVSFTGNGTYCINLTSFNLTDCTMFTVWVNSTNGTNPINTSWYRFNCSCGCECSEEIAILNSKLNYIINNMLMESDNIYIDLATNLYSIVLTLVLFLFFFSIGYKENKRSGGVFMLLSGFIFLSLEFLISSYLNTVYFLPLFTPIAIFIVLLGIRKWLFMPEHEKTKSEGQ